MCFFFNITVRYIGVFLNVKIPPGASFSVTFTIVTGFLYQNLRKEALNYNLTGVIHEEKKCALYRDRLNGRLHLKQSSVFRKVLDPLVLIIYRLLKYSSSRRFTYIVSVRRDVWMVSINNG